MNTVKKIMALITIILVVIRLFVINVYASFAAPIMAEETLKTILIDGLLAGGSDYTKDDLESWELDDLENEFEIQMTTNSNFKPKEVLSSFFDINNPGLGYNEDAAAFDKMADQALSDWLSGSLGENIYDKFHPTYVGPDLEGGTAFYRRYYDDGSGYEEIYCRTPGIVKNRTEGNESWKEYWLKDCYRKKVYKNNGVLLFDYELSGTEEFVSDRYGLNKRTELHGKWTMESDGTDVIVNDDIIPSIGEADGTQVTPDMLNPDGTVTIGGITYYPKDFIDWDKFKDPAIIDLLNKILDKIDDIPVISEQDKPLVDVDEIEVSVPEELSDYTIPVGIANVFPFCLPWDFVRGIKTLLAKPEVPVFKTEIDLTDFCGFDLGVIPFEFSLEKWEPAVVIIRWFFLFLFIITLILLTPKICKGAGA